MIRDDCPATIRPYYHVCDELVTQHRLVYRGECLVVPRSLRLDLMKRLYSVHLGVESSLRWARECIDWPSMDADVRDFIQKCDNCSATAAKQTKETLKSHDISQRPWEKVAADMFYLQDMRYLVLVDYYLGFIELDKL